MGVRVRWPVPRLFLIVVALLAAFVAARGGLQFLTGGGGGSISVEVASTSLPAIIYPRPELLSRSKVVSVVDGDTIDVLLPGEQQPVRLRYYGINAPERGKHCYREAKERNRELVGEVVLLLGDARAKDRHGRLLRYVFREDGTSIDSLLVGEGYARAWRDDGAFREELIATEEMARGLGLGCLWR